METREQYEVNELIADFKRRSAKRSVKGFRRAS